MEFDYDIVESIDNEEGYFYVYEEIESYNNSQIALCTLSAINWGKIKSPEDFKKPCELAVRALDELLDFQTYPVPAAKNSTMKYRPLGIGINNLAYWMVQNDMTYSEPNLEKINEYAEAWSYYLIKASADLANEKGCNIEVMTDTKYGHGVLPIDTYNKNVDDLVNNQTRMNWDRLKEQIKLCGIRNATLMAVMPAETSSLISNSTNGIEPPRALVATKQTKDSVSKQVVPSIRRFKNKYELLWDIKSPEGYLKICAVLQKWIDQAISVNTSYNPVFYPDNKVPMSEMLTHILTFYKFGGKNLYYNNTNDQAGEIEITLDQNKETGIISGSAVAEESCDSCIL